MKYLALDDDAISLSCEGGGDEMPGNTFLPRVDLLTV